MQNEEFVTPKYRTLLPLNSIKTAQPIEDFPKTIDNLNRLSGKFLPIANWFVEG